MCMTKQTEERSVKRDYKSRMFTMIFSDKKELLQLYNAVAQRNYDKFIYGGAPWFLRGGRFNHSIYGGIFSFVSFQFFFQSFFDVSGCYELTNLARKWRLIYHEVHGNGRLRDLLERDRHRILQITDGVTNMDICDTRNCNDRTNRGFCYIHFI